MTTNDTPLMPSVTIPRAALDDLLREARWARAQLKRRGFHPLNGGGEYCINRTEYSLDSIIDELNGWLAVGDAEHEGGIRK